MSLPRFFNECAVDFNQKDKKNKTPLYAVLWNETHPKAKEMTRALLRLGAHPGYLSVEGRMPRFVTRNKLKDLLRPFYPLPLQFLAAYVIIKNNVHYKSLVPGKVASFIESINHDTHAPVIDLRNVIT